VWTVRPKTQTELDADTTNANTATLLTKASQALTVNGNYLDAAARRPRQPSGLAGVGCIFGGCSLLDSPSQVAACVFRSRCWLRPHRDLSFFCSQVVPGINAGPLGTYFGDTCDAERESTRLPRSPVPTAPHCSPGALNDRTSPLNPHFGGVSISARHE